MDNTVSQLDLFGSAKTHHINIRAFKFCIKKHHAEKAGLHYDLRLQFTDKLLKSFAVKPGILMDPFKTATATLVDDHEMTAFRREGTIHEDTGLGPVMHFDEGFYTIPGAQNLKELRSALEAGLSSGNLMILFDGYKTKGLFSLTFNKNISKEWIIQKQADGYATETDILLNECSILTGLKLEHYHKIYRAQKEQLMGLNPLERKKLVSVFRGEGFKFNNIKLPERPHKILPYD